MDVRDMTGKAVVVTGAGSGIGRATALWAARRHATLFLCDVREDGLEETAREVRALGARVSTSRVDVAREGEVRAFADAVHAEVAAASVLVNNAGVGLSAELRDTTLDDWRWILGINLLGPIHGCHFFVPRMIDRGRGGHVVNVASMAGYMPTAGNTAYGTTKFAVVGLSEHLRVELARHGIGVTAVCPGMIDTPIVGAMRTRGAFDAPHFRERTKSAFRRRGYSPERVAEALWRAVQHDRAIAPVAAEAWALYYLKRLLPGLTWKLGEAIARGVRRELARPGRGTTE